MNPVSANRLIAIVTALCAVVCFGACKSTDVTWRKEEIGTKWEKRTLGKVTKAQNQLKSAHNGEDMDGYMSNEFDTAGGSNLDSKGSSMGKKMARTKNYRTKNFSGAADEYKSGDYHFLKRQNYNAKTSPDQDSRFATGESRDQKKRFFGRKKKARTKDFGDSNKIFGTGDYSDQRIMGNASNAVSDDRAANDGASMSVDDVRTMLYGPQ